MPPSHEHTPSPQEEHAPSNPHVEQLVASGQATHEQIDADRDRVMEQFFERARAVGERAQAELMEIAAEAEGVDKEAMKRVQDRYDELLEFAAGSSRRPLSPRQAAQMRDSIMRTQYGSPAEYN